MARPVVTLGTILLLLWVWGPTPGLQAMDARVRTQGGRDFHGRMRWEEEGITLVDAATRLWVRVPLDQIAHLWLEGEEDFGWTASPSAAEPPALGPGGLPDGWVASDVGSGVITASSVYRDGAFRIESRGAILGHETDECRFLRQEISGDIEIVGRVARCTAAHEEARAGLLLRVGAETSGPMVFWGASAGLGDLFEWRAPGETLVHLEATPAIPGMRWFKLQRSGELISGYRSRDGARWVLASQTRLPLPKSLWCGVAAAGLTDARTHSAVFEHVAVARRFPSPYRVQAELRSGSMVEAPGLDFDEEVLRFHGTQSRPAVRREHLARLLFQPVPGRLEPRLRLGQPGVLVTSGDFLEGEVRGLADGWILLDSVLSGARRLDVINQVTAVVLWPATRGRAPYEIRMRDGSIWRATSAAISGHALRIQEPLLGECELPLPDLLSFEAPAR